MGGGNDLFCVMILLILYERAPLLSSHLCDEGKVSGLMEGNFGQSGSFPWLGVLRVHLHEADSFKIALTGIVLIKEKYALGNADDVAKVPRNVLREDSKAMFIPRADEPWYSKVEDIITHPEHDYKTVNTVAILELQIDYNDKVPFLPICWPKYSFNTSDQLYVVGYTDENKLLEKQILKVQYVKQKHCDEFYTRAGLVKNKMQQVHVQCAFAERAESSCLWDTGMVLASNATGHWTIVGLGIRGPGCTAPARFIDITPYMAWIQSATDQDQVSDFRKASRTSKQKPRQNHHKPEDEIEDVPLHETPFRTGSDSLRSSKYLNISTFPYHTKIENEYYYKVDRIDDNAIDINVFYDKYESTPRACDDLKVLVYHDRTKIVAKGLNFGQAAYRLSVFDLLVMGYTCVKVKVESFSRTKATLWWLPYIEKYEGLQFKDMGYLPKRLFKLPTVKNEYLAAEPFRDLKDYSNITNINLLVKFSFKGEAILHVYVYGAPRPSKFFETSTQLTEAHSSKNIRKFSSNQNLVLPNRLGLNPSTLQNQNDSFDNRFVKPLKLKGDLDLERRFNVGRRLIDSKHRLRLQKANQRREERRQRERNATKRTP